MNLDSAIATETPAGRGSRSATAWASVVILALVTLLAFANAGHENLVLDDKVFVGDNRTITHDSLAEAFTRDVWNNAGVKGFYRPLLMVNFELEHRLFGGWARGYHLVNIALHLAASVMLLGFLRCLLARAGAQGRAMELAALLAALVFAVHPAHTEVVNSVFNRSAIYVSLCAIGGLWWLFSRLETRPASAWLGLGVAYSVGMLFKESALVMPGLAVALVVILTPGSMLERVRRFLPVFWLLLPLAVYFYVRANALAPATSDAEFEVMLDATRLPGERTVIGALGSIGQAMKLLAWPWPLKLHHSNYVGTALATAIAAQAVLAGLALVLFFRGRPALAAGLAFFYVAYLPASRLISMDGALPHVAERYLYFPSIGLSITLAFALYALIKRFGPRPLAAACLPLLLLMAAVTWDRNHDWVSELPLYETEYHQGTRSRLSLRLLLSALGGAGQYTRIVEVCDENQDRWDTSGRLANTCASAYLKQDRIDDAIRALEVSAGLEETWLQARIALGSLLIDLGRKQEGADQYVYAINRLEDPAEKELYKGFLYLKLYPASREKLEEARAFFVRASELDPTLEEAGQWVEQVDSQLESLPPPDPTVN